MTTTNTATTLPLEEGKTLLIETRQFSGLAAQHAVELIMNAGRTITVAMLTNDIEVLGGSLPKQGSNKESYARVYVQTLLNFMAQQRINKQQAQQSANDESSKAEQNNTNEKVETTMTNEQQAQQQQAATTNMQPQFITADVLSASNEAIINSLMGNINNAIQANNMQVIDAIQQVNARVTESAYAHKDLIERVSQLEALVTAPKPVIIDADPQVRIKALVNGINQHYGNMVVTEYTPLDVLEAMASKIPAPTQQVQQAQLPQSTTTGFTPEQQQELNKYQVGSQVYNILKKTYEEANKTRVKFFGSFENAADQIDQYGHAGVESAGNLLDSIVDSLANVTHGVVGVAKEVGHVGVNAVSGTVRFTGDVFNKR